MNDAFYFRVVPNAHFFYQCFDDDREICSLQLIVFGHTILLSRILLDEAEELFELVDVHILMQLFDDLALRRVDLENVDEPSRQADSIHQINMNRLALEQLRETSQLSIPMIAQ